MKTTTVNPSNCTSGIHSVQICETDLQAKYMYVWPNLLREKNVPCKAQEEIVGQH